MRKYAVIGGIFLIAIVAVLSRKVYLTQTSSPQTREPGNTTTLSERGNFPAISTSTSGQPARTVDSTPSAPRGAQTAAAMGQVTPSYLNPPPREHQEDIENVQAMLRNYRTVLGENPVGTNAEIMRAVRGGNPKQINVGPPDGQQMNEKGELIDHWGTPYFFHQLSKDVMEIRSAGPDHIMWTEDDVTGR